MALITDPDFLNQGASTAVGDMVFASSSGANTTITSAGNALPALASSAYFEVRDHSVVGNNGLYQVTTVNSSTASVRKLLGLIQLMLLQKLLQH